MLSRKERGQTKEKIDRDTRRERRKTARQARERSTDQEENVLDESSSEDDDETKPGAVEIAGPRNMEAQRGRLPDEGSNTDAVVDNTDAPAMLVEADLAPELMVADEVHIVQEEDTIVKKQYRRILWFSLALYFITIVFSVSTLALLFAYPEVTAGPEFPTPAWNDLSVAPPSLLFLATILMFVPTMRCCSSIGLEDYAPDDKRILRSGQIASAASLAISCGAIPIFLLRPDLEWLGYALMTCALAGTVFALMRVRLLQRAKEARKEKSKAFWAVFVVFFIALCGATVWRARTPRYPDCFVQNDFWTIGNGFCDGGDYNTEECGYDGGDCLAFMEMYPNCYVEYPQAIGDGHCDGGLYNTLECGYDGGDCAKGDAVNPMYPDCLVAFPYYSYIGDGICDEDPPFNTKACHYDGGDCHELNAVNETYPDCHVEHPIAIGDGFCDGGLYMTVECAYDGGDCLEFVGKYPDCHVDQPYRIGDGICDGWVYMTVECAYDGGDCVAFMDKYPDCHVEDPSLVGDGTCDGGRYMTPECAFDGGDCLAFMDKYPGCIVGSPLLIGDGVCHPEPYDTKACGYDGGDCDWTDDTTYSGCDVENPSRIGDGRCDGRLYGTIECNFDGGDCLKAGERCRGHRECASEICNPVTKVCDSGFVSELYPNCNVGMPHWIGDGKCDGGAYASEACGFDGGDCLER